MATKRAKTIKKATKRTASTLKPDKDNAVRVEIVVDGDVDGNQSFGYRKPGQKTVESGFASISAAKAGALAKFGDDTIITGFVPPNPE